MGRGNLLLGFAMLLLVSLALCSPHLGKGEFVTLLCFVMLLLLLLVGEEGIGYFALLY